MVHLIAGDNGDVLPDVRVRSSDYYESATEPSTSGSGQSHTPPSNSASCAPALGTSINVLPRPHSPLMSPLVGYSQPGTSYEQEEAIPETSSHDRLEELLSMFPSVSPDGVKFLLKISKNNAVAVTDCLLDLTTEGILDLLRPAIINDSPKRLQLDEEDWESDENLAESFIAFYKDCRFNINAPIRVCIPNQPVIDSGGARRQLISRVLATMAESTKFGLFEGPPGRYRPAFKQSSVSSGMLRILGRMIGHSIVMDKLGFPFLSPPCYYYMCGYVDRALSLVQQEDVGEHVNYVIKKVIAIMYLCYEL